jgi:hypothetical protein
MQWGRELLRCGTATTTTTGVRLASWQWGKCRWHRHAASAEPLYGRVLPAEAADPDRVPGFVGVSARTARWPTPPTYIAG